MSCPQGMLATVEHGEGQEKAGESMPLKEGTPHARDVEMAVRAPQATSPRTLALKATNPMEDHFVGSLGAALEAAGGRAEYSSVANDAGDETDGLIQVLYLACCPCMPCTETLQDAMCQQPPSLSGPSIS